MEDDNTAKVRKFTVEDVRVRMAEMNDELQKMIQGGDGGTVVFTAVATRTEPGTLTDLSASLITAGVDDITAKAEACGMMGAVQQSYVAALAKSLKDIRSVFEGGGGQ